MLRRSFLLGASTFALVACTNNQLDPHKIADDIKLACTIAVPLATITTIISAAVGMTMQGIVNMVCSAYHSTLQAKNLAAPASGTAVHFVVVVNGKTIPVDGEVT